MDDIGETAGWSAARLHELLETGDAHDRVLAVWALGLRSAAGSMMADQLRSEPDAGVRRALAVVLAGQGEIDLLAAICRHDPSVHVRASAVQMLMRFAVAGRVPWSLVTERLSDAPEVRAALMSQVDATSPEELRAAAVAGLRDGDALVRREAFETCVKLALTGLVDPEQLRGVVDEAAPGERAHALGIWLAASSPEALATILAGGSRPTREQLLRMRPELARTTFAPLLADDVELFQRVAGALRLVPADASLRVLVVLVGFGWQYPGSLRELVSRLETVETVPPDLLARLDAIDATLRALVNGHALEVEEDDELALYDAEHAAHLAAITRENERLRGALASALARFR